MNISEVAQITGLSAKQIRDYEKAGLIATLRDGNGYRHYHADDVARLHFIAQARAVGFSLVQIDELMKLKDNPQRSSRDVKRITEGHISALNDKIVALQTMRDVLQSWHAQCSGDDNPECSILDGLTGCCQHHHLSE